MSPMIMISLFIVGISAMIMLLKDVGRFAQVINVLFFAVLTSVLLSLGQDAEITAVYGLLSFVGLNLLIGQLKIVRRKYVRAIVPLLMLFVFLAIFKDGVVELLGEKNAVVHKFTVLGALLSVIAFDLAQLKNYVLIKSKFVSEKQDTTRIVELLFVGIALLFGSLGSGIFGVLIVAGGYTAASFYRGENADAAISSSLIGLISLYLLNFIGGEVSAELLKGDVLMGIFLGIFSLRLIDFVAGEVKKSALTILSFVLVIGIGTGILFINQVAFEGMGGLDALIGFFLGVIVANAIAGKKYGVVAILSPMLAISFLLNPIVEEELTEKAQSTLVESEPEEDKVVVKVIDLLEIQGAYEIVPEESGVDFFLGKKGETKGAFKKVSGTIEIDSVVENSKLNILLSLEDFTTRNTFRDKSLMSDEYFDQEKFPKMTYKSSSVQSIGENTFEVLGDFTMLGVTKEIKVSMRRIENEKGNVLVGEGVLDRTLFGMAPSSSEGNVVTFNYEVLLK